MYYFTSFDRILAVCVRYLTCILFFREWNHSVLLRSSCQYGYIFFYTLGVLFASLNSYWLHQIPSFLTTIHPVQQIIVQPSTWDKEKKSRRETHSRIYR